MTTTPDAQAWQQQPEPPKKRHIFRWVLIGAAALVVVIVAAAVAGSGGGSSTTDTSTGQKQQQPAHDTGHAQTKAGAADEVNDVKSFTFDDKSQYGVPDIWASYKITNDSGKPSDYEVDYSVINDSNGNRVEHSSIFENDVQPGQTVTGETPLTVQSTAGYSLHVTHVDRTENVQ
jgi:hypothetical protein